MDMNRENLQKLADGLRAWTPDTFGTTFYMGFFSRKDSTNRTVGLMETNCGTAGCAIGHGPHLGMPKFLGETWGQYSERVTGLFPGSPAWDWCFGGEWKITDNTPDGAADRIEVLLRNGCVPENWRNQIAGCAPLCYKQRQEKQDEPREPATTS